MTKKIKNLNPLKMKLSLVKVNQDGEGAKGGLK